MALSNKNPNMTADVESRPSKNEGWGTRQSCYRSGEPLRHPKASEPLRDPKTSEPLRHPKAKAHGAVSVPCILFALHCPLEAPELTRPS